MAYLSQALPEPKEIRNASDTEKRMDLRQIYDGGASPPTPPGKTPESPPPPGEFKKTLEQAKKGSETQENKKPGEVAETEPNAQLQKLDSKEKKAGKQTPVPVPILVEPTITVSVPVLAVTQIAALQQATTAVVDTKATPNQDDLKAAPIGTAKDTSQTPAKEVSAITASSTTQTQLSSLVASLTGSAKTLANFVVASPKADSHGAGLNTIAGAKPASSDQEQSIPVEVQKDLNIVSVQSTSNQALVAQVAQQTTKEEAIKAPAPGIAHNDHEVLTPTVTAVVSNGQGASAHSSMTQGDSNESATPQPKKDKEIESTNVSVQSSAPPQVTSSAPAPSANNALAALDRQKMVQTVAAKIDELSVKSVRNEVRVEMQPPEIGSVVVNVRKGIEGLTATLSASNEPLRQALHDSRNDLASALNNRNVGQVRVEVRGASADTMNMGQPFKQSLSQQGHQQQQQAKQAAANLASMRPSSTETSSVTPQPVAHRASTTLLDMEI